MELRRVRPVVLCGSSVSFLNRHRIESHLMNLSIVGYSGTLYRSGNVGIEENVAKNWIEGRRSG